MVCQCPRFPALDPCDPEICQSWPIAAQTWSGPAHKGNKTWYSFLPQRGRIPVSFFYSRTRTCSCPNPAVLFIVCSECAVISCKRVLGKKCSIVEEDGHSETTGIGRQGVQRFHSANILINHHYKIQAVMGTTECDRIREGREEKAAS